MNGPWLLQCKIIVTMAVFVSQYCASKFKWWGFIIGKNPFVGFVLNGSYSSFIIAGLKSFFPGNGQSHHLHELVWKGFPPRLIMYFNQVLGRRT